MLVLVSRVASSFCCCQCFCHELVSMAIRQNLWTRLLSFIFNKVSSQMKAAHVQILQCDDDLTCLHCDVYQINRTCSSYNWKPVSCDQDSPLPLTHHPRATTILHCTLPCFFFFSLQLDYFFFEKTNLFST